LWSVPREGGEAYQITTGSHEQFPVFSPDGKWIAFTGQYDGNTDVFVMPSEGGAPKRLTWHPDQDVTVGWTPDSKRILFLSTREAYADFTRLYTVPVEAGVIEVLPMWRAFEGSYSPDGARMAYVPNFQWQAAWKRYRGGQTTPIYIVRLSDLSLQKLPRQNSNDKSPVWFGDTIYFLSDRSGPVTLFAYDTKSKNVKQAVENTGFDLKNVSADPDALVYEQFGGIFLFDPQTGKSRKVGRFTSTEICQPRARIFQKVADSIQNAGISPTGARAVFEARGEILTVPAEKGDIRNLTRTPAVAERDPSWSADGKWIAYFSDESGEYALHVKDQSGLGEVKKINLGNPPSYFYGPTWSPDSKKIAYTDKRLNLWYVDVEKGTLVKVATERFEDPTNATNEAWSPDSKWLTYTRYLPNHLHAVFVYSIESGKESQISDGTADARFPVFDKNGKTLYLTASTDVGLSVGWLDLSSFQHPLTRSAYAVVLKKGDPNPIEPQSDEEKVAKPEDKSREAKDQDKGAGKVADKDKGKEGEKNEETPVVTIDLDGIGQRIVALPVRPANYIQLDAGKTGVLFLSEIVDVPRFHEPPTVTVSKFALSTRKTEPYVSGITQLYFSANGEKALFRQGPPPAGQWFIAGTAAAPKPGEGALNLGELEVYVDPRAEWNQMYHEVWRIQRDFLYDPNYHGLNIPATENKYRPYLAGSGAAAT
jgi:tricorn protease